jgi:lipopolysaccharide export system protein LptA
MACKFHAAMRNRTRFRLRAAAVLVLAIAAAAPAVAQRGERSQPLTIEADQPGTVDLLKQIVIFNGNVVITQGAMTIRADRVEVRELPDGFHTAVAIGSAARPATFRQRREGGEQLEGSAERIEYDGRADTVRFIGNAAMRRLRDATVSDEITGGLISYDSTTEVFRVEGGAPGQPGGRVRAVLTPPGASQPGGGK